MIYNLCKCHNTSPPPQIKCHIIPMIRAGIIYTILISISAFTISQYIDIVKPFNSPVS